MATFVGGAPRSHAAWLHDDLSPSVRAPNLMVALFPQEMVATAERETLYPKLWPVRFFNVRTREADDVRLYDVFGGMNSSAAARMDQLLADSREPDDVHKTMMDRRVMQLVFKAAYHFGVHDVTIISGYRDPGRSSEGRHGEGKAMDVQFKGVSPGALAAYFRTQARVGVGIYTNAHTQFVHVDHRDASFFWLDASPPGRRWRERPLARGTADLRDGAYRCEDDWPEGPLPTLAHECGRSDQVTEEEAAEPGAVSQPEGPALLMPVVSDIDEVSASGGAPERTLLP